MSTAKPHAVPIGLSSTSALAGSIACFRLLGGITRLRALKNSSIRASHSSLSTSSTPAACAAISCERSSTVGPSPPLTIDRVGALAGELEREQQVLAVVADRRLPRHREPEILELLADVAEVAC